MKYTEILRKGNCVLVDHEAGQQYIVGVGYDPDAPDGQKWGYGMYFPYWMNADLKGKALSDALDFLLVRTDETYISRCRLEEIATRALDEVKEAADPDYLGEFISELDLSEFEKGFFEIDDIDSEEVD